jgi:hypothetical protein
MRVHTIDLGCRRLPNPRPRFDHLCGAIETAEEFGKRLYLEAWRRGWGRAVKKVVMGDGSEWIWTQADQHFPGATQILDLYHAREHLWDLARRLYPNDEALQKRWRMIHGDLLENGKIKKLVMSLQSIQTSSVELAERFRTEPQYFRRNARRMRYLKFRRQHLFVGTGVIEAGCKTVIGSRCKQSGMFWTVRGVNAILALHCAMFNGRFEDYWETRHVASSPLPCRAANCGGDMSRTGNSDLPL